MTRIAHFAALALLLTSCAPSDFDRPGPITDASGYTSLYPYYVELCAVSGVDKYPGFGANISGGPGGHSVLYLNGVCRDRDAHYPVIALCKPQDSEKGVGISANAHFRNANWIATDGPDFFFHGSLRPGERLTQAAYQKTQRQAEALGLLDGVVFHSVVFQDQPANMSRQDWMYEMSVSTDYAINFGRGRYCGRMPVSQGQMARIVDFLNARNAAYRNGAVYNWNVLQDNCAHLTHNALAAAGVWDQRRINRMVVMAALTFPVPKDDLVHLLHRANDLPLHDLRALFQDPRVRDAVLQEDWLPTEPGALLESESAWKKNDVYDPKTTLIFYQDPVFSPYQTWFDQMVRDPRYHDATANLRYFNSVYAALLRDRKPLSWWLQTDPALARAPGNFPDFYQHFYCAIENGQARVEAALRGVTPPPSVATHPPNFSAVRSASPSGASG